jgi:S1-C subfamily serine protease
VATNGKTAARWQWFVLAPGLLVAGAWLGQVLPLPTRDPLGGLPTFAPIVKRIAPAIVSIHALHNVAVPEGPVATEPSRATMRPAAVQGSRGVVNGTGLVIDKSGLVVTNHHLVHGAYNVLVTVPEHGRFTCDVIGTDAATDLALLQIVEPPAELVAFALTEATGTQQGDWILAIGNPFGFERTVTPGIVSYVGRYLRDEDLPVWNEYLQFSAPVNPGSSGAPVLNVQGEVIGITTRAFVEGDGISFAVPSRVVRWVVDQLRQPGGQVVRGDLGMSFQKSRRGTAPGVTVTRVVQGEAAAKAGLQRGDTVLSLDGKPITSSAEFREWITRAAPGTEVSLEVMRDGQRLPPVRVQLGEYVRRETEASDASDTGAGRTEITR